MSYHQTTSEHRLRRAGAALLTIAIATSACAVPTATTEIGGSTIAPSSTTIATDPPDRIGEPGPVTTAPDSDGNETSNRSVLDTHLAQLDYGDGAALNEQDIADGSPSARQSADPVVTEQRQNNTIVTCTSTDYDLQTNFSEVAILRPTNGAVFPGALVRADASLLDGVPVPLGIEQGPLALSIDLPGIGEAGALRIEQPTNSSVQAAVDGALDWWNRNAYIDGYVNAANSSFQYRTAYSTQQAALDVGLNVAWATGDFAGRLSVDSSSETRTTMATFKQAFYTVSMDTPASPASMISTSVPTDQALAALTADQAPAYVSSVVYGRILMVRMESSRNTTSVEAEAALNYAAGVRVEGQANARYEEILAESSLEVITIGGNAAVQSRLIDPTTLPDVIQGENALYSISNPGVPIAYSVRHLHDNSLAKLGYTTEYTATECANEQVGDTVRVTLIRFQAIDDCDGIEGDGDFSFVAEVRDRSGNRIANSRISREVTLGDSDFVNVLREVYFDVAWEEGAEFSVVFIGTEVDQNIVGYVYNDDRMSGAQNELTHVYDSSANAWTNLTRYGTGLGGTWPATNQIEVGTGECRAELHYVVDFI